MPAPRERRRERVVIRGREPGRVEERDAHKASGYRRAAREKTTGAAMMSAAKTVK